MTKKSPLKLDFNERSDYPNQWLSSVDLDTEKLWLYPDKTPLESRLAQREKLSQEQVFCSNGGDEAIFLLMRIIKETSRLILPLPAFSQYTWGLKSWKIKAELIAPNADLSIDTDALLNSIQQQENSVIVLTRPNNPTGESISESILLTLIKAAQQNNSWVFIDEAYIEFSDDPSAVQWLSEFDNLVILRTLSKAYGLAGIRLGYLLGSKALINAFKSRAIPFNVPSPTLSIAENIFSKPAQDDMQAYVARIKKNRTLLFQWLQDTQVKKSNLECLPAHGNFLLIRLRSSMKQCLLSVLKRNNISIRTFTDSVLRNCIRITIPYELDPLMDVLQSVLQPDLICMDMDGVLIDTRASYDASIIATVKYFTDVEVTTADIMKLRQAGGYNNDWVLAQALAEQQNKQVSLDKVTEKFQEYYLGTNKPGYATSETALISQDFVSQINQQPDSFAVVTGRPKAEAIAGQNLIGFKNIPLKSDDDVRESKPSPEGINALKATLNKKTSWMIGDTPDDIQAALSSDSVAIGIAIENKDALYDAGADLVISSINELETWL